MVNEFNKIIAGMLAAEGAVHFPQVGSLAVVRRPAERISSRRLRRSCNAVIFTEKTVGRSVVEAVAELCDADMSEAQEIYERWLSKCSADGVVAIDGVGHIEHKQFFVENEFDKLLNPNGHHVVELTGNQRGAALKWALLAIVLLLLAGGAVYWSGVYEGRGETAQIADNEIVEADSIVNETAGPEDSAVIDESQASELTAGVAEASATPETDSAATEEPENMQTSESENQTVKPSAAAEPERQTAQPAAVAELQEGVGRLTSGWNYVVYGVFSTPENAMRAVTELRGGGVSGCSAFAYGPKYMVALYFSASQADCTAFIRSAKEFENLWVYTAR